MLLCSGRTRLAIKFFPNFPVNPEKSNPVLYMRSVTASLEIKASPERILEAFLNQPDLNGWWGVERSLVDKKPGGLYTLAWGVTEYGSKYVSSGIIKKYEPHEQLLIGDFVYINPEKPILGPLELNVRVELIDTNISRVHVKQGEYPYGGDWDWYYEAVVVGWPSALELLKKYLENPNPLSP